MSSVFTESVVEDDALAWWEALGYATIAAGEPAAERSDPTYRDAVLEGRLRQVPVRFNPELLSKALADASLRDTLLPKLFSGELAIKDAERIVEDVTQCRR